jgi:hypothetical protein
MSVENQEPTFGDLLGFLWTRRVRLTVLFLLFGGVSLAGLLLWRLLIASQVAEGTLSLTFRGIERHEYPSGRKFSVEDIRSPQVLERARANAGLPAGIPLERLYVGTEITPVIPSEIQARWRKQDRDGVKREEFFPQDFRIRVSAGGLVADQRLQFLSALTKAYQDEVRFEQQSSLRRMADFSSMSPSELVKNYDTWDLPNLLRERERSLRQQVEALVKESREFKDPKFGLSFRDVANDLQTWRDTRLEEITAFIYRGRVVRDRDLMVKRLQQRLDELDVEMRQSNGEAEQSTRLIESLDRSKPLLAGPLTNRDGAPLVDTTALEKLVRSDYVGPVVKRITELHQKAQETQAERARVERELTMLSKSEAGAAPPASGRLEDLVIRVTNDFGRIVKTYNDVLDQYLTATVTSLVTLKEGPRVTREGPPLTTLAAIFLVISAILPFVVVFFEQSNQER